MNLIHAACHFRPPGQPVCVAIGVFDGVHLGHQQVIRRAVTDAGRHGALPVVITFDRHPTVVVAPDRVPPLIQTINQKLRSLGSLGVHTTWLVEFNEEFSRQTGEEFVRCLVRDFRQVRSICAGADFTFGHKRSGSVAVLQELGAALGFTVQGLAPVSLDGLPISSTRIREAIRAGQLESASRMLGRPYALAGTVVRGDQIGRQLGFPTANLDVSGLVLPPNGVYAVHAGIDDREYPAVLNIGLRPTLRDAAPQLRVEAHLLDFDSDLYGSALELRFEEKLRDEQRFPSLQALKVQIARDVQAARECFDRS